jgi:hypothetical protein
MTCNDIDQRVREWCEALGLTLGGDDNTEETPETDREHHGRREDTAAARHRRRHRIGGSRGVPSLPAGHSEGPALCPPLPVRPTRARGMCRLAG